MYSVPQYLPCPGQTNSFDKLYHSFSTGHPPSPSEVTGSWVLIGFRLYRDSHPDLRCDGIMRGRTFEWVMLAQGYSLRIEMAGTDQASAFQLGEKQDLTIPLDLGGDASPLLCCRVTRRHTLVCLGDTYYNGLEFRKVEVHCEPPMQNSKTSTQPTLCYPIKKNSSVPE